MDNFYKFVEFKPFKYIYSVEDNKRSPTEEQYVEMLEKKLKLLRLQAEYAELSMKIAVCRLHELEALAKISEDKK